MHSKLATGCVILILSCSGCAMLSSSREPAHVESRTHINNADYLQRVVTQAMTIISSEPVSDGGRMLTLNDYRVSVANVSLEGQQVLVFQFDLKPDMMDSDLGFPNEFGISINELGEANIH